MSPPRPEGLILAADLGGSGLALGLLRPTGEILRHELRPTAPLRGGAGLLTNLLGALAGLQAEATRAGEPLRGIGLGLPGAIHEGVVGPDIQNLPELAGQPIRALLEERTGLPVAVDNDVNALALAEWTFGQGRGLAHLAYLAVGTGVGGGLILNRALVRGASGYAGEIGHIPVELEGRPCFCGSRGCVKAYAAGPDLAARAKALARQAPPGPLLALAGGDPERIDCPLVFAAAAQADPTALAVVEKAAQALGAAVAALINLLNPELIALGGGVLEAGPILLDPVRRWAERYAFAAALGRTRIVRSTLTKAGGILGGAALLLYEEGRLPGRDPAPDDPPGLA